MNQFLIINIDKYFDSILKKYGSKIYFYAHKENTQIIKKKIIHIQKYTQIYTNK